MKDIYFIKDRLLELIPESEAEVIEAKAGKPWIQVNPQTWAETAKFLRDDSELRFNTLMCLSGLHYPDHELLGVAYHLHSTENGLQTAIKVLIAESDTEIPSVEKIWKTADWHEREAYDMFGIRFKNHPNMSRILCPDDWEGYPLRKDYVPQTSYMGITTEN